MVQTTMEEYQKMSAAQRKHIRRNDLQAILDEHVNSDGDINTIRGIIREELDTKFEALEKKLTTKYDAK